MTLTDSYEDDLHDIVDGLEDAGIFAPGEPAAWREGIEDADHMSDLMIVNEALVEALSDRDGFEEFRQAADWDTDTAVVNP
jgi:hypothetical protein